MEGRVGIPGGREPREQSLWEKINKESLEDKEDTGLLKMMSLKDDKGYR